MSKPEPLQYGQYYHIYNRGNNREILFREQRNYHYFLKLYAKHIEPVAATYVYCLMSNHFHLLVRIKTVEEQEAEAQSSRPKTQAVNSTIFSLPIQKPSIEHINELALCLKAPSSVSW